MSTYRNTPPIFFLGGVLIVSVIVVVISLQYLLSPTLQVASPPKSKFDAMTFFRVLPPTASPSAKPTPRPYPPASYHCVKVPILMYHHVEPMDLARAAGHGGLTVDRDIFAAQMEYLRASGYRTIRLADLVAYFDQNHPLPPKPVVLTFDDAYADFHTYALPILSSHAFVADLFVPTGLIENPGYLTWSQIRDASNQGVSIDHHTWSHANMTSRTTASFAQELDVATTQLAEHGYGSVRIFAYPYGAHDSRSMSALRERGFALAVTTVAGTQQCKEDRLALRRTRIGNQSLKSYGL